MNAGIFNPVTNGTHTFNLNQYYTLSVNAVSNVLMLYIDGSLKYTYTDTSSSPNPYNSYNAIGLRTRDAVTYFDDVRIDSQATAPTSYYRYNPATGTLMHELDAAGNIKVSYTTDPKGNPVSVTRYNGGTATNFFYHYNAHGDVIAITDANGSIVAKFNYDAWGVPTELSSTGAEQAISTWTIPTGGSAGQGIFFLFGGMLYDAAAGLYLTKTRAYNPKTGRFLQRDILDESAKDGYDGFPFGKDAIGTNLYAWCGNNPVSRVDHSGQSWLSDLVVRGARAVVNIAAGIGAGISGAQSSGGGGAYGLGYRIGSGARAGAKKAAAAVKAAAPQLPAWTRNGPTAANRVKTINNLRNMSLPGISSIGHGSLGGLGSSKRWEDVGVDLVGAWGEAQYEAGMAGMAGTRGACWKACGSRITGGLLTSRGATLTSMSKDGIAYRGGEMSGLEYGFRLPLNAMQMPSTPLSVPARQLQLGIDVGLALNDDLGISDSIIGAVNW